MTFTKLTVTALSLAVAATGAFAQSRDEIRIVGSSTVFPFSTAVAEQFGRSTDFATPVVESTGSGGGLKLFCAGVGTQHPDITNSSRRIKESELKLCMDNGVTEVTEAMIGFDGIVVANAKDGETFELTREMLVLALAEQGDKPMTWDEVDPGLPPVKIEVLGPPPSSGTRDAFEELVMHEGCEGAFIECEGISIRQDGVWVDAGENDNLIVSKLEANPGALGVFGFSFLDQNADALKGAIVDGVEPTFDNIADGAYPVSRSLFFYIKNAHVDVVPGIQEYATEFLSDAATGEDGYLVDFGLIPAPEDQHDAIKAAVEGLSPLSLDDLK
ncbi:MAG: phosphate ABC transporter substrate-binding protein [Rhodobacteraceae bacterium]|nr:phosphate ABC transporter substrate-binding protein [Paracoccaceae bacterium]